MGSDIAKLGPMGKEEGREVLFIWEEIRVEKEGGR